LSQRTDPIITVTLSSNDVGQIADGLEVLADQWENTSRFLDGEPYDVDSVVRECSEASEARSIAATYRRILQSLYQQLRRSRE
jgi:hypothetical protein